MAVGLSVTAASVMTIFKATAREFTFCSTYEDAATVYKKFYGLNFRQYGVDIPPRLDDLRLLIARREGSLEAIPDGCLPPGTPREWTAELTRTRAALDALAHALLLLASAVLTWRTVL